MGQHCGTQQGIATPPRGQVRQLQLLKVVNLRHLARSDRQMLQRRQQAAAPESSKYESSSLVAQKQDRQGWETGLPPTLVNIGDQTYQEIVHVSPFSICLGSHQNRLLLFWAFDHFRKGGVGGCYSVRHNTTILSITWHSMMLSITCHSWKSCRKTVNL